MKTNIMIAMLGLFVSIATFSNAATALPTDALLVKRIAGGMPGPHGSTSETLTLLENGDVVLSTTAHGSFAEYQSGQQPQTKTEVVAKILSKSSLKRITDIVGRLEGGALVPESNAPMCMDAPGISYKIVKNGKQVEVTSVIGCVAQVLADREQQYDASQVKHILDALSLVTR